MKEAKRILTLCIIITIFSFLGIVILHYEIDVWIAEAITKKNWECLADECDFYQSQLSNIFTGALVSMLMSIVTYRRAKHDLEFEITSNSKMILVCCDTLSSGLYKIDLQNEQLNSWPIFMYKEDVERIAVCSDKIIEAQREYCPFITRLKKVKNLRSSSDMLQQLAIELFPANKYIMFQSDIISLKESMEDSAKKIEKRKEELEGISSILEEWNKQPTFIIKLFRLFYAKCRNAR